MLYLWLKALHVAAAIAFTAGIFSSAIFIHWLQTQWSSSDTRNIASMLRSWNARVTTPAMLVIWGLGLTLASQGHWISSGWLKLKFACVLALSALHGIQSGALRRIAVGSPAPSALNTPAVPFTLVAIIVVLVIAKPI